MRWKTGRRSKNVEDRRGLRPGKATLGGGFGLIVVIVIGLIMGVSPMELLEIAVDSTGGPSITQQTVPAGQPDEMSEFLSVVLADTEDVWGEIFRQASSEYREPKLVLFNGAVNSACGYAQAAMGPFYCPGDEKVYIDLSFFRELANRHGATGDFAQAYVIAHEIGHHVQNLMGLLSETQKAKQRLSQADQNKLSVLVELQADCFAGVWAHRAHEMRNILEQGDMEEALNAASAIGDDRLQRQSQGYVVPDSFTHGTSEQRRSWFDTGLKSGRVNMCNTLSTAIQ